ncbi:F-box/LRR-repeat protein At4g14103 [Setaria italica]|uniref:F-box/LRR-repeat protein At4g14103 n=1 Tax=Setaria italica TaxID=4555 RepID=UPI000647D1AD|nr:F-box/LRR-repeat protein At4g14103 [Setaria italica]
MQAETGSEDRISALRNEILQYVISFLPAQEAVQTCVLAKGWCHLWKSMPVLRIIADEWQDEQGVKKMNMFMKNLLLKRNGSAPVDVREVRIGEYVDAEGDPQVDLLIRNALLRQARIIRVTLTSEYNWAELGGLPFISQHLTWLELTHVELRGDVLDYSSCPALKNLHSILIKGLSKAESLELEAECTAVPDNWDEMEGSYDPLAQPIASKKLKVVKVHYDELDGRVHNIVRIMKSHLGIEEVNGEESFQM